MTIALRNYQQQAADNLVRIIQQRKVAYLAGACRTGKTLTALEAARLLGATSAFVATKKKAVPSILKDAAAIGLNSITVTNFEQVHKFAGQSFDLLIVDESHAIGAYPRPSKRFRDLKNLRFAALLLMSATPSPESFSQLFFQLNLSSNSPWAQYRTFYAWANAGYVNVQQKYVGTAMPVNDYSNANKAKILADLEPLTVQMTQQEAGFSQPIIERVHMVPMRRRTYRMANRIMRDGVVGRPDCRSVLADTGAKVMSKMRQLWSGTVITEAHGSIITDDSKAQYIIREWLGRSKVAILYTFDAERRMLEKVLQGFGVTTVNTPEAFNAGDRETWFIGQVQASREGVNLSTADDLVFFGIDYAALSYLQGRDRASYRGRDQENRVHWLLAAGGMEPRILETVQQKQDFTVAHYRHARNKVSAEIDGLLGEARLDGAAAAAHQQRRPAGSSAATPATPAVVRGGQNRQRRKPSAGVPARGVASIGLPGGRDHAERLAADTGAPK
jgi:hypothetical protein